MQMVALSTSLETIYSEVTQPTRGVVEELLFTIIVSSTSQETITS